MIPTSTPEKPPGTTVGTQLGANDGETLQGLLDWMEKVFETRQGERRSFAIDGGGPKYAYRTLYASANTEKQAVTVLRRQLEKLHGETPELRPRLYWRYEERAVSSHMLAGPQDDFYVRMRIAIPCLHESAWLGAIKDEGRLVPSEAGGA